MCSKFETLAIELWLEIFSYLKIRDQYNAFHGLNRRFNQFLLSNHSYISLKHGDKDTQYVIEHVLPYLTNRERVNGLRLEKIKNVSFITDKIHT